MSVENSFRDALRNGRGDEMIGADIFPDISQEWEVDPNQAQINKDQEREEQE